MTKRSISIAARTAGAGLIPLLAACQQGGGNASGNAAGNTAAAGNAAAPADTGPIALATDTNFPAVCQTYIQEVQACLNGMTTPDEADAAARLRDQLNFHRREWGNYGSDAAVITRMCTRDRDAFLQYKQSGGVSC